MGRLKKISKFVFLIFAILGVLFSLLIVYFIIFPDDYFLFKFSLTDDGSPLNGEVYLNEAYLGETKEGRLKVNLIDINTGDLVLLGSYNEEPFEIYWEFKGEWIKYGEQEFIASSQELLDSTFDTSNLDLRKIEREVFELVNLERQKYPKAGIRVLRWNEAISEIAREHSEDLLEREYFSHRTLEDAETLESVDFSQRLRNANIFYLVSNENLLLLPVYPDTNIATEAIESWLGSPGHRHTLLDLDNLYSDAGVGIACMKKVCYITMDFIALKAEYLEENLKYNYLQLVPLYPEGYGFEHNVSVSLNFKSSSSVILRLTQDRNDFNRLINRDRTEKIIWTKTSSNYQDTLVINPSSYLIIESNVKDVFYNLTIDYLII